MTRVVRSLALGIAVTCAPACASSATAAAPSSPGEPTPQGVPIEATPTASSAPQAPPRTSGKQAHGLGSCTTARCDGAAGPDLVAALSRKAGEVRACYEQALRLDPDLGGRFVLTLHIEPSGSVCDALVTDRQMESLDVPACARSMFLDATFPPPEHGCVIVHVPLSFVSKQDGGAAEGP